MQSSLYSRSLIAAAVLCVTTLLPQASNATIVEFELSDGTFIEVNLYDNATPQTVANFLNYVQNGNFSQSVIHRSVAGFVIQGGGFVTDVNAQLSAIPENAPVNNEPTFSNVRGSIAMAKLGSGPDTATSQWFFNLANNAANLDNQNGGFTVFGEVTGTGMATIDAVAALPTFDLSATLGGAFTDIPLQNYTAADFNNNVPRISDNFVIITAITVTDTNPDSAGAAGLNPALSTANNGGGGNGGGGGGGGGGSLGLLALLGLSALGRRRYRIAKAA